MLKIIISDPGATLVDYGFEMYIISTSNNKSVLGALPVENLEELDHVIDEGNIYRIKISGSRMIELSIFKSITSNFEVFYGQVGKHFIVSDHFKNVLALLSPDERHILPDAIIDHYLFHTVIGYKTFIKGIKRLGHGELLNISAHNKNFETKIIQKLHLLPEGNYDSDRLSKVIEKAIKRGTSDHKTTANLLTGGIDSTLIHTYLNEQIPSIHVGVTTKQFYDKEVIRSLQTAKLFTNEHKPIILSEEKYAEILVNTIKDLGIPANRLHTALLKRAFQENYDLFVTGQNMEKLFGLPAAGMAMTAMRFKSFTNRPFNGNLYNTDWINRFSVFKKFESIISRYHRVNRLLAKSYSDPEGFALTAFSAEYDLAGEFFNEDEIIKALLSRYDYTMQRITWEPTCNLGFNHMELGSLITFFCENMIGTWRSAAFSNASGLHAPGLSKELIDYLMSIKLPNRYIKKISLNNFLPGRDYGNRYALKKLLKKRLPSYQTNARKFGSRLPLLEYISGDGPLADIFSRYEKPDFIEGKNRNALDKPTSKSAYFYFSSLTYSIWHDELIETDKIDPAGKAKIFSLQI